MFVLINLIIDLKKNNFQTVHESNILTYKT